MNVKINQANCPTWREVATKAKLPAKLQNRQEMAHNVYWSWNTEIRELFQEIDEELWESCAKNPVLFLNSIDIEKLESVLNDKALMKKIDKVYDDFKKELKKLYPEMGYEG